MSIHPTAIIAKGAKIAGDAVIGPYCVVGPEVSIGKGTVLHSHVAVGGCTSIGENNKIFPFVSLGHPPQDLKYGGEKSELIIGNNNTIREHVTMNPGTAGGGMVTRVGDNCLFMVASHVAHDCAVGDNVILANNATLAGHVHVGEHAIIGGLSAVHQFVRIGRHAIIGGMSGVEHDVIPFGSVMGERASLAGLNLIGLKRRGFDRDTIHALRGAYKQLFDSEAGTLEMRAAKVGQEHAKNPVVTELVAFIREESKRQLCVPKAAWQEADSAA